MTSYTSAMWPVPTRDPAAEILYLVKPIHTTPSTLEQWNATLARLEEYPKQALIAALLRATE